MEEISKIYNYIRPYAKLILIVLSFFMFFFLSIGDAIEDEGNGWVIVFDGNGQGFARVACAFMLISALAACVFQFVKIENNTLPLSMIGFILAFVMSFLMAVTVDSSESLGWAALLYIILALPAACLSICQYIYDKPQNLPTPPNSSVTMSNYTNFRR